MLAKGVNSRFFVTKFEGVQYLFINSVFIWFKNLSMLLNGYNIFQW
jgi:hypothetical protein